MNIIKYKKIVTKAVMLCPGYGSNEMLMLLMDDTPVFDNHITVGSYCYSICGDFVDIRHYIHEEWFIAGVVERSDLPLSRPVYVCLNEERYEDERPEYFFFIKKEKYDEMMEDLK